MKLSVDSDVFDVLEDWTVVAFFEKHLKVLRSRCL